MSMGVLVFLKVVDLEESNGVVTLSQPVVHEEDASLVVISRNTSFVKINQGSNARQQERKRQSYEGE
jgi:hypothetical protein